MKAFILAAGQGTRLLPLTNDKPKCMVEYKGRPIIDYTLDALRSCGVEDITIIKGYLASVLQRSGTKEYINEAFDSTNMLASLFCAEEAFDDDILICYGDIVFEQRILKELIESPYDFAITADTKWYDLWKQRMPDPLSDAETLILSDEQQVLEIGKKPKSMDDIHAQYMGLIKVSKNVLSSFTSLYHKLDTEKEYAEYDRSSMYMTDFLERLGKQVPLHAVLVNGGWLEVDAPSDLEVEFVSS